MLWGFDRGLIPHHPPALHTYPQERSSPLSWVSRCATVWTSLHCGNQIQINSWASTQVMPLCLLGTGQPQQPPFPWAPLLFVRVHLLSLALWGVGVPEQIGRHEHPQHCRDNSQPRTRDIESEWQLILLDCGIMVIWLFRRTKVKNNTLVQFVS